MSPLAVCLRETDTIDEAARFFLQSGISSTPVLDADGGLAGFLSEKDLMVGMISPECWQHPLSSVMRPNVISYEEDTPIRVIYEFLCRVSIRGVVITRNGRAVGTISRSSLFHWFRDWVISRNLVSPPAASVSWRGDNITDMASEPGHRSPDNAWRSRRRGETLVWPAIVGRVVPTPSQGDGVDRAAADSDSQGNLPLREPALLQHPADFTDDRRRYHCRVLPRNRLAPARARPYLRPAQRRPTFRR